jgi:hypothetical protein
MVSCSTCLLWAIGYIIGGFILCLFGIYVILQIRPLRTDHPSNSPAEQRSKHTKLIWKILIFVLIGGAALFVGIDLCGDGIANLIKIYGWNVA